MNERFAPTSTYGILLAVHPVGCSSALVRLLGRTIARVSSLPVPPRLAIPPAHRGRTCIAAECELGDNLAPCQFIHSLQGKIESFCYPFRVLKLLLHKIPSKLKEPANVYRRFKLTRPNRSNLGVTRAQFHCNDTRHVFTRPSFHATSRN
jgi:hypothetical protein